MRGYHTQSNNAIQGGTYMTDNRGPNIDSWNTSSASREIVSLIVAVWVRLRRYLSRTMRLIPSQLASSLSGMS